MADHVERALEVYADDGIEIFFLHHGDELVTGDARVVYENVYAAEIRLDCVNNCFGFVEVSDIAAVSFGFSAHCGDFCAYFRSDFAVSEVEDRNVSTHGAELFCNSRTDSA